jgi:hypothetical protein
LFGLLAVLIRSDLSKDVELLGAESSTRTKVPFDLYG